MILEILKETVIILEYREGSSVNAVNLLVDLAQKRFRSAECRHPSRRCDENFECLFANVDGSTSGNEVPYEHREFRRDEKWRNSKINYLISTIPNWRTLFIKVSQPKPNPLCDNLQKIDHRIERMSAHVRINFHTTWEWDGRMGLAWQFRVRIVIHIYR